MPAWVDWGRREYVESLSAMRELRARRRRGEIDDTLILVEHPAVYTVGVQGDEGDAYPQDVPVVRVERGGRATYHGPGQLVGYPIVDLDRRSRDVRKFVHDVEELVVRALADVGVSAERVPGKRGVWVEKERKIASVGVAIEEWVSFHGFALNVSTDLTAFERFHPCGFDGRVMTSVERELGRPCTVESMKPRVLDAWATVFAPLPPSPSRDTTAGTPA